MHSIEQTKPHSSHRDTSSGKFPWEATVGLLALLTATFAAFVWLDTRHAQHDDMLSLEQSLLTLGQRLELKVTEDRGHAKKERIWKLADRLGEQPDDATLLEELRKLRMEEEDLNRKLKTLQNDLGKK